jgi:(p)ppGpp synthase/HD superfamily hydrolase
MEGYSRLYQKALRFAALAHQSQVRKGSDTPYPYITHPVHVSRILCRHGFDTEIAAAALLHDIVEDQEITIDQVARLFGNSIAAIVEELTERKRDTAGRSRPWELRKQEALAQLDEMSLAALAIKAADALHNVQSLLLDIQLEGDVVWQRFSRGPQATIGYYRSLYDGISARIGESPLTEELANALDELAACTCT